MDVVHADKLRRAFADKALVTGASALTSFGCLAVINGTQLDAIGRRIVLALGIIQGVLWIYYTVRKRGRGRKARIEGGKPQ